jgi:hypothetical protein
MLHPDSEKRFSIEQVKEHCWIRGWQDEIFIPLDVKSKSEIIQKCCFDHKISSLTDINNKIEINPYGPIGGIYNIHKHLYQSIKLSQTYMKVCEIKVKEN